MSKPRVVFSLPFLTALLLAPPAHAAWQPDGIAVSAAASEQLLSRVIADGAGGSIVVWRDLRGGLTEDLYAQRLDAVGAPLWLPDGVVVSAAAGNQTEFDLASDGAGGVIVTWQDERGGTSTDIYAQRVSSTGAALWTPDGVPVCTAAGNKYEPRLIAAGAGGAFIAWEDARDANLDSDIYAQRLDGAGNPLWAPNGLPVCGAAGPQYSTRIVSDGTGGAIVVWQDYGVGPGGGCIFAQRVDGSGTPQWNGRGLSLENHPGGLLSEDAVADGVGGVIATWAGYSQATGFDIHSQRMAGSGARLWGNGGLVVCAAAADQEAPALASDGAGGAIVAWDDPRQSVEQVFAQRVSAGGQPLWLADGLPVVSGVNITAIPAIRCGPDGSGGAYLTWADDRLDPNLGRQRAYAQRLNAQGAPQWTVNGIALTSPAASDDQRLPALTSNGTAGLVVAWQDFRIASFDIYAQRIDASGTVGSTADVAGGPVARAGVIEVRPNPMRSTTTIRFALRAGERYTAVILDASGRLIRRLADERATADESSLTWDGRDGVGVAVSAGLYLIRVQAAHRTMARGIVLIR